MSIGKEIEQDVMAHFALRGAHAGSTFDRKGFWRLAIVRYPISPSQLNQAFMHLESKGFVSKNASGYILSEQGSIYLYGEYSIRDRQAAQGGIGI